SSLGSAHHQANIDNLERARDVFETTPFNFYSGMEQPELLIITGGVCWLYTIDAVKALGLEDRIGVLRLGTMWPLPQKLIKKHLGNADKVLFVEHVESHLEDNIMVLAAGWANDISPKSFYGKHSGHVNQVGEVNTSRVMNALSRVMEVAYVPRDPKYDKKAKRIIQEMVPPRDLAFCPGCPHRTSFWVIKNTLKMIGRDGFCTGDIGCYSLAARPTGYEQLKTLNAMGSGVGMASGFGKLAQFDFDQPVVAVCGDSTFYHAAIPALINAVYNKSDFTMIVLDNCTTAMTGFQPHPGVGKSATGLAPVIDIADICRALGVMVKIADPFDIGDATYKLLDLVENGSGPRVLIMRRHCEQIRAKEDMTPPFSSIYVDPEKCYGDSCGCNRLCTRVFRCPGIVWNNERSKAEIDAAVCTRCGVCADLCPQEAITVEVTQAETPA
ncbi:thiamine pyrophosphate-dependent enzyme, partial [Chloroflexota bacterium]